MFTFLCTTCEAKLIAKNEKLLGQIVPCPQCGSMVFVQPANETPSSATVPPVQPLSPVRIKRFPDVLSSETASGIIGHTSKANLRSEEFLEVMPQESDVSETEIKTRKVLVNLLIGLSIFLLVALGFLMVFQGPDRPPEPPPQPEPIIQVPPEPPPPEQALEVSPIEPALFEEIVDTPPLDEKVEPVLVHDVKPRVENDTLSAIAEKMPDFVDHSVPNIDIDAKLALSILELNFNQQNLIGFVRSMSRLTEIPMTLDIDAMKPHSLSVKTPVSGQFNGVTAGEILTETLATLNLQWITADRQILILPKETANETGLTFDVADFAERTDDLIPEVLAEMVQRIVCPETAITVLPDNRLSATPNENNGKSPKRLRDDILRFLEQLRAVRQLPQKTEWSGETLAPEAFGWDRVMMPMTLNHYREVPLSHIFAQLEEKTNLTIIVDHQSLHRAFCPLASVPAAVQCDRGTVNDVLELSLASVDLAALTYRIVDHQTLEITTMESARQPEKMVMEVHRFELREDETPEDIVRALRSAIVPHSWSASEFQGTQYGGDIVIDHSSSCLFVRQSQPAHRQIRLFLAMPGLLTPEEQIEP